MLDGAPIPQAEARRLDLLLAFALAALRQVGQWTDGECPDCVQNRRVLEHVFLEVIAIMAAPLEGPGAAPLPSKRDLLRDLAERRRDLGVEDDPATVECKLRLLDPRRGLM